MLQINMFIRKFYACKCLTMEVGNEADMVNKCINAILPAAYNSLVVLVDLVS